MIKIVIIEDERIAARQLERLLTRTGIETEVVATIDSVGDAIDQLGAIAYDLILMDIHLSDGNAFQIFEGLDIDHPVIFTTAYDSYALKAFRQNSVDYLLKPIALKDLQLALKRYIQYYKDAPELWSISQPAVRGLAQGEPVYRKRILLQTVSKIIVVDVSDISCFDIQNKTVYIRDESDRTRPIEQSLGQLEEELNPNDFFRINRSCIVARSAVDRVTIAENGRLKVQLSSSDTESLLVSIDRASRFKKWLGY